MKLLITLVLLTLISGCTHSLYGAKFTELNHNGDNKDFLFYWTKTAPLLGKNTAGPGILVEQCSGSKYTFVESDDGIKMTAASGDFIPLSPINLSHPLVFINSLMNSASVKSISSINNRLVSILSI